ncbi:MAG: cytochrome c family protein [Deltaproteobacteria bacterium]|nr:cytochrome c family protein [Deltaproteobacteria bacterium]
MYSMKANDICSKKTEKLIAAGALVVASAVVVVLFATAILPAQTRQKEVAVKGAKVMPFDLEQTTHVFQKLDDGGLQKVIVKDSGNKKQIALIQSHLKEESEKFRKGDFSDPAKIHGENMPGLAELKTSAARIDVRYTALSDGAQIRYATKDVKLITAIHRWFDTQLSDHGHHATHH